LLVKRTGSEEQHDIHNFFKKTCTDMECGLELADLVVVETEESSWDVSGVCKGSRVHSRLARTKTPVWSS
jgi:hypothetical protein